MLIILQSWVLAYRPFLDPIAFDGPWLVLAVPLVLGVCVIYKTIKLNDLSDLVQQSIVMAVQIMVGMAVAAGVLWSLTCLM